jgi:hypothetical protein
MTLSAADYLVGLAYLLISVGAPIVSAFLIVRRRLAHLTGIPRLVAISIVATALIAFVHLLPAALTILTRGTVAVTALLLLAIVAIWVPEKAQTKDPEWPEPAFGDGRISRRLAFSTWLVVAVYVAGIVTALAAVPPGNVDTLTFHLPEVGRWIQTQSIWQIDQFVPDQAHGYYPNTGNLFELALVLPWHSDFAIRFLALPFLGITSLGVYGAGRELRAPASAAALGSALVTALPVVLEPAVQKPVIDAVCCAGFAAGVFFLLRYGRVRRQSELVLAGVSLGIAFGTKWYGVSSVLALIAVWALFQWLGRRSLWSVVRDSAVLLGLVLAVGGVWLVRNVIESGNPVYPSKVSLFGIHIFTAPRDLIGQLYGHTIAEYFTDPGVWTRYLVPSYRVSLGISGVLLAVGLVGAMLIAWRRRRPPPGLPWVSVAAIVLALVYAVTPYSALGPLGHPTDAAANTRYLVPALLLAAALTGWAIGAAGRVRHLLEAAALISVLDALHRGTSVDAKHLVAGLLVVGALLGAWYVVREGITARIAIAGSVAVAVVAGILGFALQKRYLDDRYTSEPVIARFATTDHPVRVGIAGSWSVAGDQPVLPTFGPRYENHVEYVGRFEDGMLRPATSQAAFVQDVHNDDLDLLLIGKRPLPTRPDLPEQQWAEQAGYRVVAEDSEFVLLARHS